MKAHWKAILLLLAVSGIFFIGMEEGLFPKAFRSYAMGGVIIPLIAVILLALHVKDTDPDIQREKADKKAKKASKKAASSRSFGDSSSGLDPQKARWKIKCGECGWEGVYKQWYHSGDMCPRCKHGKYSRSAFGLFG